ncbi:hypothetical protein CYMTET_10997 [Cymbomonas tetramitiformis]|uniref:Cyclic nucleotide-binding domain-containing protein n=1 Tax=Cymbomonas tetramitiformis TaxID=36881 RepID=A0AAE0GNL4_9CHLO|nr:hypothetical protein CYMTET_10997 [Cymbomonas tetramitiformis]
MKSKWEVAREETFSLKGEPGLLPKRIVGLIRKKQAQKLERKDALALRSLCSTLIPAVNVLSSANQKLFCEAVELTFHTARLVIYKQNDRSDKVFFVLRGTGHAFIEGIGVVAVMGPGDVFGEMGVVQDAPRAATCFTRTSMTCLVLDKDTYLAIFTSAHESLYRGRMNFLKKQTYTFAKCCDEAVLDICRSISEFNFPKGTVLPLQSNKNMYFLITGDCWICAWIGPPENVPKGPDILRQGKYAEDDLYRLKKLFEGDTFGESSFFPNIVSASDAHLLWCAVAFSSGMRVFRLSKAHLLSKTPPGVLTNLEVGLRFKIEYMLRVKGKSLAAQNRCLSRDGNSAAISKRGLVNHARKTNAYPSPQDVKPELLRKSTLFLPNPNGDMTALSETAQQILQIPNDEDDDSALCQSQRQECLECDKALRQLEELKDAIMGVPQGRPRSNAISYDARIFPAIPRDAAGTAQYQSLTCDDAGKVALPNIRCIPNDKHDAQMLCSKYTNSALVNVIFNQHLNA